MAIARLSQLSLSYFLPIFFVGEIHHNVLLIDIECLEHLLIGLAVVHLEVREELSSTCDLREESAACGVIFLVLLEMLRNLSNLFTENADLHLRRTRVFCMCGVFSYDLLLVGFLERHRDGGETGKEFSGHGVRELRVGPPGK